MRSASQRGRLTCLFRTLSMALLHSRCFRSMCLRRTCSGSFLWRLAAGSEEALEPPAAAAPCQSTNATTDARPLLGFTSPSHCTAASTRAPDAMRGRPALRRKTVLTAVSPPIAAYSSLQTRMKPRCSFSRRSTATSGVAVTRVPSRPGALKLRSPNERVHLKSALGGATAAAAAAPPPSPSSSSSSSASGSGTACALARRTISPERRHARQAMSPRLATATRSPMTKATAAQQPSLASGFFSAKLASSSSKVSRRATLRCSSSHWPRNAASLGSSLPCKCFAQKSEHVFPLPAAPRCPSYSA
mmetsp:Transcript_59959/g.159484  ORF Transcript_59959/g.159484 Transcript_59959/m.159484 type:complete len:303 (+) Transcript_59959:695-1603(+)